jgi:hypothetical protein
VEREKTLDRERKKRGEKTERDREREMRGRQQYMEGETV